MTTQKQYAGFLGRKIEHAMLKKGMRVIDLSDAIGTTYETARKLVRGQTLAKNELIRVLSRVLGLGIREMQIAVRRDRAHAISPRLFWSLQGMNPELEFLYMEWEYMSSADKNRITEMALLLAEKDRKNVAENASGVTASAPC